LSIIEEKALERMESLLNSFGSRRSRFVREQIDRGSAPRVKDDRDFYDFDKMKRVQNVMTELIAKKTYFEKVAYLRSLDLESFQMVVRAYFHIVKNTVRATHEFPTLTFPAKFCGPSHVFCGG